LPIIGKMLERTQPMTTPYTHLASDLVKAAAAIVAGKIVRGDSRRLDLRREGRSGSAADAQGWLGKYGRRLARRTSAMKA
jgi:hypothetical protein